MGWCILAGIDPVQPVQVHLEEIPRVSLRQWKNSSGALK